MGQQLGIHIYLDFSDIAQIDTGRNNSATFDASMIFLHELQHDKGKVDPPEPLLRRHPTVKGQAVVHMNKIRKELGLPLRGQYRTEVDESRRDFIPFTYGPVYVPAKIAN